MEACSCRRERGGSAGFESCGERRFSRRGFHCQGGEESFLGGIGRAETELFLLEDPRYAHCFLSSLIIHCLFPQFVIVLLVLCFFEVDCEGHLFAC